MYGQRMTAGTSPRYLELLELLKNECDSMHQEANMSKIHREDVEVKMYGQLFDLTAMQKAFRDLERSSLKVKQQLEDEIGRLRHELQSRGSDPDQAHPLAPAFPLTTTSTSKSTPTSPTTGRSPQQKISPAPALPASAVTLIQFPTPPNLELELQGFASGFTNLNPHLGGTNPPPNIYPAEAPIAHAGQHGKRSADDDMIYPRHVRPREDTNTMLRRASLSQQMPASAPVLPQRTPLQQPARAASASDTALAKKEAASAALSTAAAAPASGFDWLVVYNPKAERSITIDLLHTMPHEHVVCCVRFSHDGRYLATGSNRAACIFDTRSGERVGCLVDAEGLNRDVDQYIRSVAFSPDGRSLVTGSEDQTVRVWDIASQTLKCKLVGHSQDIYSVDFMPGGREVVSASGDRTIRVWEVEGARCKRTLTVTPAEGVKDAGITSLALSPNGKYIAAGSLDKTIRLWSIETGQALETLEGHRDSVYSVCFAQDGRHLISGSLDKTIKVWQFDAADSVTRASCKYTILGHKDFVLSVVGTPLDGRWIVSGSKDRSVQFWDSHTGTTQLMLQGHKNSVISIAVSPTGGMFATGSGDSRARIWTYNDYTAGGVAAPAAESQSPPDPRGGGVVHPSAPTRNPARRGKGSGSGSSSGNGNGS